MPAPLSPRLLIGFVSGLVATVPQTLAMWVTRLLQRRPGAFPPRQVAEGALRLVASPLWVYTLSRSARYLFTAISHFGYGATAGTLYGLFAPVLAMADRTRRRVSHVVVVITSGAIFGLAVWAFSYGFLLPALKIVKPQGERPLRKNVQLIVAHLAWGVSVAVVYHWLMGDLAAAGASSAPPARKVKLERS